MTMKRHSASSSKPVPIVPTASMADIAFLLIIFFMLTTSFSPDRTSVELPDSIKRNEVTKDPAIVAITLDGTVLFSDGERDSEVVANMQELRAQIDQVLKQIPAKEFVVKADRGVLYKHIDQVLDELRGAGARNIGLLTNQKVILGGGGS